MFAHLRSLLIISTEFVTGPMEFVSYYRVVLSHVKDIPHTNCSDDRGPTVTVRRAVINV